MWHRVSLWQKVIVFLTFSGFLSPLIAADPAIGGRERFSRPASMSYHVLAANDLIEIKVFQEPELDTAVRIPVDGRITMPLIGEISVSGKTVQQATQLIRDRLESRFLVSPQVTLTVAEPAKRLFTVLGQVQRPGTYRFPDLQSLNLIQVIGIAGGYTRIASPGRITLKRRVNGVDVVFRLDGNRMAGDINASPFGIQPGDMITVGERIF